MANAPQSSVATTAKFNTEEDEAPVPRNLKNEYVGRSIPVKSSPTKKKVVKSPRKRPASPTKRPASPSKLATHLAPDASWARTYVRGVYYDDAINIVPNTKSPRKSQVKHGQMNFFMGSGTKAKSLKTANHITVDEEGNMVFA